MVKKLKIRTLSVSPVELFKSYSEIELFKPLRVSQSGSLVSLGSLK